MTARGKDTSWFQQMLGSENPSSLIDAWDWFLDVGLHPEAYPEAYSEKRWQDHRERELFDALKDKELWALARLVAERSAIPESRQTRLASLPV